MSSATCSCCDMSATFPAKLINYITNMNGEYKVNTRLDMLMLDGFPGHIHMINYFTKYRDEIFQYAIFQSDVKPSSIKELTISHLHSFLGMRRYVKGIGAMSAEERMAASKKGYENGIGVMLAEERMAASKKGSSNDKMGIAWEEKYAEFKRCVEMPEFGTPLYNWQNEQKVFLHKILIRLKNNTKQITRLFCRVCQELWPLYTKILNH